MSSVLKSRPVWIACIAGWGAVGVSLLARDLLMIGTDAPTLQPQSLIEFLESMLLWGLLSPFIIAVCAKLPLDRQHRWRSLALHAVSAAAFFAIDLTVDIVFARLTGTSLPPLARHVYQELFINNFSYAAVAAAGYAFLNGQALSANRLRSAELERRLAQAKLEVLARRLQPHFLFNSLNSISALIRLSDNERALHALVALSDLLRAVLSTDGDARVSLAQEIDWAERYLRIERLRFENRLQTEVRIDPAVARALVPALVLQPFVENAVRHGVESHSGATLVSIAADRHGDDLWLTVRDASEAPAPRSVHQGFGLGLESTRERLAHLYGSERFEFDVVTSPQETTARIRIPYLEAA
jgi:hypothetical protein